MAKACETQQQPGGSSWSDGRARGAPPGPAGPREPALPLACEARGAPVFGAPQLHGEHSLPAASSLQNPLKPHDAPEAPATVEGTHTPQGVYPRWERPGPFSKEGAGGALVWEGIACIHASWGVREGHTRTARSCPGTNTYTGAVYSASRKVPAGRGRFHLEGSSPRW